MATVTYLQKIRDQSPTRAGFSAEGGKITDSYYVVPSEINDAILDILGDVTPKGDGTLKRSLPKHHPQFPWLFASHIESIQGLGQSAFVDEQEVDHGEGGLVDAEEGHESDPITDQYWEYPLYEITVAFSPRPYAVLGDDNVEMVSETAYEDDGTEYTSVHAEGEELRFVFGPIVDANPELITGQQGQMTLITGTTPIIGPTAAAPHGYGFSGFPSILLGKAHLHYQWFNVPYSYVTSKDSYLVKHQGRVNQLEFDGYGPGELLYLGFKATPHVPPVPDYSLETGSISFTTDKNCNITLMFDLTTRTAGATVTLPNASQICAGHNLQPWFTDRKFYPAITAKGVQPPSGPDPRNVAADWKVTFPSFVVLELFTDPDA